MLFLSLQIAIASLHSYIIVNSSILPTLPSVCALYYHLIDHPAGPYSLSFLCLIDFWLFPLVNRINPVPLVFQFPTSQSLFIAFCYPTINWLLSFLLFKSHPYLKIGLHSLLFMKPPLPLHLQWSLFSPDSVTLPNSTGVFSVGLRKPGDLKLCFSRTKWARGRPRAPLPPHPTSRLLFKLYMLRFYLVFPLNFFFFGHIIYELYCFFLIFFFRYVYLFFLIRFCYLRILNFLSLTCYLAEEIFVVNFMD